MKRNPLSDYEDATTRQITNPITGQTYRVRKIEPTTEALRGLGLRTKRTIIGHLAINPPEIERKIKTKKAKILREMAFMHSYDRMQFAEKPIDFVEDKENRKQYEITCTRCGDKVATVWARNEQLEDWCDLHYITWYDKRSWHAAMAINVSPIDGKLGIECACGEDTRDFRASTTLPPIQKSLAIDYTMKHRAFGAPTSAFITTLCQTTQQ